LRKTFNCPGSLINISLETQGKNIIRKKFYFQALLQFVEYSLVKTKKSDKRGLFMGPTMIDEAKCPNCQGDLIYIEHYQSYYCSSCDEHFKVEEEKSQQAPESPVSEPSQANILDEILGTKETQAPPSENTHEQKEYERPPPPSTEQTQYEETPDTQEYEGTEYEKEYEESQEPEPEVQYEEPEDSSVYEEPQEPVYEEESAGVIDEDYETQVEGELEEESASTEGATEAKVEGEGKKRKIKFKNYRYRTRMIKGSVLPIIFGLISFQMINSSRLQFPDYYELEPMIILAGFILGFSTISAITMVNLIKAKKSAKKGYKLNMKVGVIAYLPFIVIFMGLTLFVSLSTGWKFATGFFLASVFPILIVMLFEATSKGKFFVKEAVDDPSWGRKLVFKT
jgi:hypothetical protein